MAAVRLPMSRAMRGITIGVVVTGVRRARVRLWIGTQLIRLAALVIGCGVDVSVKPDA